MGTFRIGKTLPSSNWWALASFRLISLTCPQTGLVRVEWRSSQLTWKIETIESQRRKLWSLSRELKKLTRKYQGSAIMKIASCRHLLHSQLLWRIQALLQPQSANSRVCSRWRRKVILKYNSLMDYERFNFRHENTNKLKGCFEKDNMIG